MKFKPEHLAIVFVIWEVIGLLSSNVFMTVSGLLIIVIMFGLIKDKKEKEKSSTISSAVVMFENNNIEKYHIGTDNKSCVGINEANSNILILTRNNVKDIFNINMIKFNELIEVKLIEDDLTITSTDRASQLGGALVGGVLAGGIGAIIGGSGGTQYSEKKVKKVELEFVIDSLENPIQKVSFMNEDSYIDKYDKRYKNQFELANNWYKMFSVILRRNENEYKLN